jgi:hypothetical protein
MAEKSMEKQLIETMKTILENDAVKHVSKSIMEDVSHNVQFRWEDINDSFSLEVRESEFFNSLTAAFYKVHSYKFIDDEKFDYALLPELKSQGVPQSEIDRAISAVEKIRKEFLVEYDDEKSYGWPQNIDGIRKQYDDLGEITEIDDDRSKDTFSGDNEPSMGSGPDNTRPVPSKI